MKLHELTRKLILDYGYGKQFINKDKADQIIRQWLSEKEQEVLQNYGVGASRVGGKNITKILALKEEETLEDKMSEYICGKAIVLKDRVNVPDNSILCKGLADIAKAHLKENPEELE